MIINPVKYTIFDQIVPSTAGGDLYVKNDLYAHTNLLVAYGGGSPGETTTANGTVTLIIAGNPYYLLKAATA